VELALPAPIWEHFANAQLVAETKKTYTVSFLDPNPGYPAWFTVVFDRRTLYPMRVQMTAAAHFMHVRYVSWDKSIKLHPPG